MTSQKGNGSDTEIKPAPKTRYVTLSKTEVRKVVKPDINEEKSLAELIEGINGGFYDDQQRLITGYVNKIDINNPRHVDLLLAVYRRRTLKDIATNKLNYFAKKLVIKPSDVFGVKNQKQIDLLRRLALLGIFETTEGKKKVKKFFEELSLDTVLAYGTYFPPSFGLGDIDWNRYHGPIELLAAMKVQEYNPAFYSELLNRASTYADKTDFCLLLVDMIGVKKVDYNLSIKDRKLIENVLGEFQNPSQFPSSDDFRDIGLHDGHTRLLPMVMDHITFKVDPITVNS